MTLFKNKKLVASLKDERGVTILMALLALLVAAMVSAVILSAAMSTVKQEKSDTEFQQCQLDLQSAAQFVLADIVGDDNENGRFTVNVRARKQVDEDGQETWIYADPVAGDQESYFSGELVKAVDDLHYKTGFYPGSKSIIKLSKRGTATGDSGKPVDRTVNVTLTAQKDIGEDGTKLDTCSYVFEFKSGDEGTPNEQTLYMTLKDNCPEDNVKEFDGGHKTLTYRWSLVRFKAAEGDK